MAPHEVGVGRLLILSLVSLYVINDMERIRKWLPPPTHCAGVSVQDYDGAVDLISCLSVRYK